MSQPKLKQPWGSHAMPKERVVERTQGCWNCKHFIQGETAKAAWNSARARDLQTALGIVRENPEQGENHPKVLNIRRMVNLLDHAIAQGEAGVCGGKGVLEDGKPVGDFVASTLLCRKWSGAQGASVARAGQKADDLPMELAEKIDGGKPKTLDELLSPKPLIKD